MARRQERGIGIDPTDIMSRREIADVLADLHKRSKRGRNGHQTMIIFRLAVGAGLRADEIASIEIRDLKLAGDRPHIEVRSDVGKGGKARVVPLWWDVGTLEALTEWRRVRVVEMNAKPCDPVVCVLQARQAPGARSGRIGTRFNRTTIATKFKSAIRCLGSERCAQLHTHSGRHTFGSYMVHERGLAAVQRAMGHADISTTGLYLHVLPEDLDRRGSVFTMEEAGTRSM